MNVQPINFSNYNSYSDNNINFKRNFIYDKVITCLHLNPLLHFKHFSTDEYFRLSEKELGILRNKYAILKNKNEKKYNEIEEFHQVLSDGIQERFDKKYGKGEYTVIVLGRSLSSIGKVLGYKIGENNVKNIPLSRSQKYLTDRNIKREGDDGLNKLLKYLKSIGLGKKEVTNPSNKHKYVLVDFCYSGCSMEGARNLLQSKYIYGKNGNIKADNVVQTCISDENLRIRILKALFLGKFKDLAFVKYCSHLSKTCNSVRKPQKADNNTKLTWFNLLDMTCSK